MVQEAKSPVKNFVRQSCAETFNSGVKGLNRNSFLQLLSVFVLSIFTAISPSRCEKGSQVVTGLRILWRSVMTSEIMFE
jgi:phosphomevalonate kinase